MEYVLWKTTLLAANKYLTKKYILDNFLAADKALFALVVLKYTTCAQPWMGVSGVLV